MTSEEKILKEGLCNRVKSKLFVENGHGLLTNKRFIYNKHSLAKIAAMGILVNFTKGTYDFDIELSNIVEIKDGKQGISKTIIIVDSTGTEYNFYVTVGSWSLRTSYRRVRNHVFHYGSWKSRLIRIWKGINILLIIRC